MALPFIFDADIESMLADSPHTFTAGEVTALCLFDESDGIDPDVGPGGGQRSREARATVRTSTFPGVAKGDSVSITDGAETRNFEVWDFARLDDGALTQLFMRPQ